LKYVGEGVTHHESLEQAATEIGNILNSANEGKREVDRVEEIFEELNNLGVIFGSHSQFLEQSPCGVVNNNVVTWDGMYFLFTDVLVVVRVKEEKWVPIDVVLFCDGPVVWKSE